MDDEVEYAVPRHLGSTYVSAGVCPKEEHKHVVARELSRLNN
jgi:hypothetical protein